MAVSTLDYALMAGYSYYSTRGDINRTPFPSGWLPFDEPAGLNRRIGTEGFEAASFQRGNEIVIAFAGTYPKPLLGNPDIDADIDLGTGDFHSQLLQAAQYYLDIKKANPNAVISFTGHSLSGGLAALMAVFFDLPAQTFDQAPFSLAASVDNANTLYNALTADLIATGTAEVLQAAGVPYSFEISRRSDNVRDLSVTGEFLSTYPLSAARLGISQSIQHGAVDVSVLDLHSQDLLIALKNSEKLRQAAYLLPYLVKNIFDNNLFMRVTDSENKDFLANLIRYEFGIPGETNSDLDLLTKFGNDTAKLSNFANAGELVTEPLLKILMNYYYEKMAPSDVASSEFLTKIAGGLQFDLTQPMRETALSAIKGYADLLAWITQQVPATLDFNIYDYLLDPHRLTLGLGSSVSVVAPNDSIDDFMLGGPQSSNLNGGAGDDVLIGLSSNDSLIGDVGDDVLVGGAGNDRYEFKSGDGADTIIDSDGKGSIYIDGQLIAHGFHQQGDDATIFHSQDGKYTLTQSGNDLVITPTAGGSDSITVRDYFADAGSGTGDPELEGSGVLGIELDGEQFAGYGVINLKDYFFNPATSASVLRASHRKNPAARKDQAPAFPPAGKYSTARYCVGRARHRRDNCGQYPTPAPAFPAASRWPCAVAQDAGRTGFAGRVLTCPHAGNTD
jgi:hypothetical protein